MLSADHVVVKSILLYGFETWVITSPILVALEGVNVGFYISLGKMVTCRYDIVKWTQPSISVHTQIGKATYCSNIYRYIVDHGGIFGIYLLYS